jgi:hypothetical protein
MGLVPTPDLYHRVVIEIPGPQDEAKFNAFRDEMQRIIKQYGGRVVEEVKTKKKVAASSPTEKK